MKRDWWKTQINFLLKEFRVKLLHELGKDTCTEEEYKKIFSLEESQLSKIMNEIDTRKRYEN